VCACTDRRRTRFPQDLPRNIPGYRAALPERFPGRRRGCSALPRRGTGGGGRGPRKLPEGPGPGLGGLGEPHARPPGSRGKGQGAGARPGLLPARLGGPRAAAVACGKSGTEGCKSCSLLVTDARLWALLGLYSLALEVGEGVSPGYEVLPPGRSPGSPRRECRGCGEESGSPPPRLTLGGSLSRKGRCVPVPLQQSFLPVSSRPTEPVSPPASAQGSSRPWLPAPGPLPGLGGWNCPSMSDIGFPNVMTYERYNHVLN